MNISYFVTTRLSIVQELKNNRFYIIGIDGTVPQAEQLYDRLYDHHRSGGEEIQLHELPVRVDIEADKIAIITTMVDADAIASAYYLTKKMRKEKLTNFEWLEAISYECDHLGVPKYLDYLADDAAQFVAALKENSKVLAEELNLPRDRREWSVEDKEKYASLSFHEGVKLLDDPNWNYRTIAEPYWDELKKNVQQIIDEDRIQVTENGFVFDQVGFNKYIDPRCWLKAVKELKLGDEKNFLTLACREVHSEGELKGLSYTVGTIPLHPLTKKWDFTKGVFEALSEAEKKLNPNSEGWGGRKTVGGSGFNTSSLLSPEQVFEILDQFV